MDHLIYLALGSNVGNRAANLKNAINNLAPQIDIKDRSAVFETPPWGFIEQESFYNQAVKAKTYMEPLALLKHLKRLEVALGRTPSFQNGPRLIDIDILFYDNLILDDVEIQIPHTRLHERAFVLAPLVDLEPALVHPVLGRTVKELLAACDKKGIKKVG